MIAIRFNTTQNCQHVWYFTVRGAARRERFTYMIILATGRSGDCIINGIASFVLDHILSNSALYSKYSEFHTYTIIYTQLYTSNAIIQYSKSPSKKNGRLFLGAADPNLRPKWVISPRVGIRSVGFRLVYGFGYTIVVR